MIVLFFVLLLVAVLFSTVANEGNAVQSADPDDDGNGWERLGILALFLMGGLAAFFFLIGGTAGMR